MRRLDLRRPAWRALLPVCGALLFLPVPSDAQYFGRNKVQYDDFDWRVIETENFDVHFYPEERVAATDGARMVERWNTRLEEAFQHRLRDRKPIIYYADHPDFQQTNVISGLIGEGTGGVTEGLKNRMILPFTGVYEDNDHVIGHELVHVYQYDIAGRSGGFQGLSAMARLPLWLVEGMAEYLSTGRADAHTAMWMRDAALRDDVPTIQQLTRDPRYFPYRYGQALLAYVAGLYGDGAVTALFRTGLRAGWEGAVRSVLGMTSDSLSKQWIAATRAAYLPAMSGRTAPMEVGELILAEEKDAGSTNISPALSPDGRFVAFITEKDLFSYDFYIADAHTGELLEKLASADSDMHFDALSFLQSAGTWSPDNRRFAFVVFAEGENELAVANVESGDIERRIAVQGVGALRDPSWSPDGRQVAFTGISGGISDLYVMEIETGQVRQLTNDRHADLQPAWSPDGSRLAFATDRGEETDFSRLVFGPMRLGVIDVASGELEVLPSLGEQAKHINPQWAPDGASLYFVSDPNGFSDVYRMELATGSVFQVTNVATGVSGITDLSPALTVASRSGRVMFSVFGDGQFTVHALTPEQAQGTPVGAADPAMADTRILPPVEAQGRGLIANYLDDALTGLPSGESFAVNDYESNLTLDYIGTPAVGVGYNPTFGAALGGAVSFYFSDLMGNRELGLALQAQGTFKDIGGQVIYLDSGDRWNWGVAASHIPYLSGGRGIRQTTTGYEDVTVRQRFYMSQLQGLLEYPFSMTRRFEISSGYTRYAYDVERETLLVSGGRVVDRTVEDLDSLAPNDVHMVSASPAMVGDNSYFAFVGPVRGWRYRYEASPTVGSLNFVSLLADYRRYFFFNPLTVAFRGMHFGYWFGDESDPRLRDAIFIGYESLIRGYSFESFEDASECTITDRGECAELKRLFGSRLGLVNLELRVPVFGVEEFGLITFPYLPMELAAFVDGGFAWCGDSPVQAGTAASGGVAACGPDRTGAGEQDLRFAFETDPTVDRVPVFSAGLSSRFNILGYVVLEVYYAYPFQRPNKGWHLGFNLAPGW